jgi:alpha-N-arabinofuranosidase
MANVAQMVNVIQSLVLTRGADMVVTPTWHVFDLYKVHQGATMIPVDVAAPDYVEGKERMPQVNVSGSRDPQGVLHLSIVNLDPDRPAPVRALLAGGTGRTATAETLTAARIDTRVEFGKPDPFVPRRLQDVRLAGDTLTMTLPARSVTLVTIR